MIRTALLTVLLLQFAAAWREKTNCNEGLYWNRMISKCLECDICGDEFYALKPCTATSNTECVECGIIDHESEDFRRKCVKIVDKEFYEAVEAHLKSQLQNQFRLREVKMDDEAVGESDELYEIRKAQKVSLFDEEKDEESPEKKEEDSELDSLIKIEERKNDEKKLEIGEGAVPAVALSWITVRRRIPAGRFFFSHFEDSEDESDEITPVEVDESESGADINSENDDEKPIDIIRLKPRNDKKPIILDEDDDRLLSFDSFENEDKLPFEDLLKKEVRKPLPAVKLFDPLFEEPVEDDDSDEKDVNEALVDVKVERTLPKLVDYQKWMQRRGGVRNFETETEDDESSEEEENDLESEYEAMLVNKRQLFVSLCVMLTILMAILLLTIKMLRQRRVRMHAARLYYLSPAERELIERAAGNLAKKPVNVYENHVYEHI